MLPLRPPVEPMLARLARMLPAGAGLRYEPKWDGFRCLAFVTPGAVVLASRNERPLQRYFPDVVEAVTPLGEVVLDGELVVHVGSQADFPALMARLHPAPSRVALLAGETPACLVVFDLLAVGGEDLTSRPYRERRERLEAVLREAPPRVQLTEQTDDVHRAELWLDAPAGSGIDGVVVRDPEAAYQPGRRALVKVKRLRTADLVVAGVRATGDGGVGSLLLGGYDDAGALVHVGVVTNLSRACRSELARELAPLEAPLEGHPWEHGFGLEGGALGRLKGTAGRWTPDLVRDWLPVRPERVAEIGYDHVEGYRFRHPARFLRWRPDRNPDSCSLEQLR